MGRAKKQLKSGWVCHVHPTGADEKSFPVENQGGKNPVCRREVESRFHAGRRACGAPENLTLAGIRRVDRGADPVRTPCKPIYGRYGAIDRDGGGLAGIETLQEVESAASSRQRGFSERRN